MYSRIYNDNIKTVLFIYSTSTYACSVILTTFIQLIDQYTFQAPNTPVYIIELKCATNSGSTVSFLFIIFEDFKKNLVNLTIN